MKKIGIITGVIFAVMGFIALLLPMLVNKSAIQDQVVQSIKNITGIEPVILGNVSASFFPVPKVTISQLGIKNAPGALSPYIIQLQSVELYPEYAQAFSSSPKISKVVLIDPKIELETLADGKLNWHVAFPSVKSFYQELFDLSKITSLQLPNVQIVGAAVRYVSPKSKTPLKLDSINGIFSHSEMGMVLDVAGQYKSSPLLISGKLMFTPGSANAPLDITFKAGANSLSTKAELKKVGSDSEISGDISFTSDDMFTFSRFMKGAFSESAPSAQTDKIPLSAALKFRHFGTQLELTDMKLDAPFIKASSNLKADLVSGESVMNIAIASADMDAIHASNVLAIFRDPAAEPKESDPSKINQPTIAEANLNNSLIGLSDDQTLALSLQADKLIVNKQVLTELALEAEFSGAFADITSAKIKLPGATEVSMMGTVKNGFQGLTFEGTLDSWGQNFAALMPLFNADKNFLPPKDFMRFRLKSDQVVFSPLEARIIEARMQIETMAAVGTVISNYKDSLKVESKLTIRGLNIDNFIAHHAASLVAVEEGKSAYISMLNNIAQWLKSVSSNHVTRIAMEQFTLNGEVREKADIDFKLSPTKFDLSRLALFYNGSNIVAALGVENVAGAPLPKFTIKLEADQINTATLLGQKIEDPATVNDPAVAQPSLLSAGKWPREEFEVYWLDDVDLNFEFKFGSFVHKNWQLSNVSGKGTIVDRTLTFDPIRLSIWGADTAAKLSLTGGKLPLLGAAFTLNNVAMEQLRQITPLFNGMEGKFNINGVLSTSGVSPYFLVSNLGGKLGVAGRDVLVKGFNLRGIVRSVSAVRSVADILNVVRLAFPGGDTNLGTIQGNFNINNGIMQTPGISVTTNEAAGMLAGNIDLVKWRMDTNINFDLSTLDKSRPPVLRLLFSGDLERPQKGLDTKSLEEFVALKTKEKYLQDTPVGQ